MHLQELDQGLHVWDAVGPARDLFDGLSAEINTHLRKFGESLYGEVRWTLCMTGRTTDSASPTILFLSPKAEIRKSAKDEIKSSKILKKYPGFRTMDCNRPPGFFEVISLGRDDDMDRTNASNTTSHFGIFGSTNDHIVFGNIEGARIYIEKDDGTHESRSSTAGGIIRLHGKENKYFVMTVAHNFPEYIKKDFHDVATTTEFEYELDDWSEEDEAEMDIAESEMMSKASLSPPGSDSEESKSDGSKDPLIESVEALNSSDSSSRIKSSTVLSVSKSSSSGKFVSPKVRDSSSSSSHARTGGTAISSSSSISARMEPAKRYSIFIVLRDGSSMRLPKTPSAAQLFIDKQDTLLDYALIEISHSLLDEFTGGHLNDFEDHAVQMSSQIKDTESKRRAAVDIICTTASRGSITPTFQKLPSGHQEFWTVHLEGFLSKGDSGSWVRDAETGKVYGHLVAGSLEPGFAYIIPMRKVMEDIERRLGGKWELMGWMDWPKDTLRWHTSPRVPFRNVNHHPKAGSTIFSESEESTVFSRQSDASTLFSLQRERLAPPGPSLPEQLSKQPSQIDMISLNSQVPHIQRATSASSTGPMKGSAHDISELKPHLSSASDSEDPKRGAHEQGIHDSEVVEQLGVDSEVVTPYSPPSIGQANKYGQRRHWAQRIFDDPPHSTTGLRHRRE